MSKSIRKNIFISDSLVASYNMNKKNINDDITDFSRNSTIIPIFLYEKIGVYNGRNIFNLYIKSKFMLNNTTGSFSFSKKKCVFLKKNIK